MVRPFLNALSPSGKASDFDFDIRRFESCQRNQNKARKKDVIGVKADDISVFWGFYLKKGRSNRHRFHGCHIGFLRVTTVFEPIQWFFYAQNSEATTKSQKNTQTLRAVKCEDYPPLNSSFFISWKRRIPMTTNYKRNKKLCTASSAPSTHIRIQAEKVIGPFESCGNCPYPSHGFICYTCEGNCMKTDMERMNRRNTNESKHQK